MERRTFLKNTGLAGLATLVTPAGIFQSKIQEKVNDDLLSKFTNPSSSAKPHTWWHWMNGNVTRQGITLDVEAMARVGLGGFQNFDAGTGIPKGPVEYLSNEWLELKKHTISEAQRLGLEFTMHNCPGWSSSGGPWITPELAMQEVTFSELVVTGDRTIKTSLPRPFNRLNTYKDIRVIACRSVKGDIVWKTSAKSIRTNRNTVAVESVTGEKADVVKLVPDDSGSAFLEFEFRDPVSFRQLTFITAAFGEHKGPIILKVSEDGKKFTEVGSFNTGSFFGEPRGPVSFTQNLPLTTAKYVRIMCDHERELSQIRFSPMARPADWEKRSNFSFNRYGVDELSGNLPSLAKNDIIDVSEFMQADGAFQWNAPAGTWSILRFGYTPIGTLNRSAPDTGVGLECDKFSAEAFEFHFNKMMEQLLPLLTPMGAKGKVGLLIDSYEVGMQNWTPGFEKFFQAKTGYELYQYLPTLIGRVVESTETTDRFLWDLRRVQGDLMADNYYGKFTNLCHQHNIISYIQPYDRGPMEEMQIGSRVDINVGEFWNNISSIFQNNWTMRRTVKLSASIAHTNGQKIVAAESFTGEPESSKWQEHPFALKMIGDRMFTEGLNRMIFHRFAHQPHPTARPGMTMGAWGSHFDRTNTWWEQGKSWIEYLTRCQALLQEGLFVADLAYYTGEDAGVYTSVERFELTPPPPHGIDYDLLNSEVLSKAKVSNGKLVLPTGMSYAVLILQNHKTISLDVLNTLKKFASDGLSIIGEKPMRTPGLRRDDDQQFARILEELWDGGAIRPVNDFEMILKKLAIQNDFSYSSKSGRRSLRYIHRQAEGADIYFVSNESRTFEQVICTFRVDKKQPEIWDPVTGTTYDARMFRSENGLTILNLEFGPVASVFVVFRKTISSPGIVSIKSEKGTVATLEPYPSPAKTASAVQNFTISFWAKPENSIMLSTNNFMDGQDPWTDLYAIYPNAGAPLYGDGHATAGLAVGRNGIAIWENSTGRPVFKDSAARNLSGWTHIAISYRDGVPEIFVMGERIKVGTKSPFVIHPPTLAVSVEEGASFFNGDLRDVEISPEILAEDSIARGAKQLPSIANAPSIVHTAQSIVAFGDGEYTLARADGNTYRTDVKKTGSEDLSDEWRVRFPEGLGAPSTLQLSRLTSLHLHENPGVKYFSGTCSYEKSFTVRDKIDRNRKRYFLDLGEVEVIAEISLNGTKFETLWTRPFMVDVTEQLRQENNLIVKVTNLWPNRLIGDEQLAEEYQYAPGAGGSGFASLSGGAIQELPDWYQKGQPKPAQGRVTFATWKHYTKDSPLLQSGLIGPVTLRIGRKLLSK